MSYSEKYLFQKLNTDDADNVLQKGTFRSLVNGRIGVTADKSKLLIENIKGNTQVSYQLPTGSDHEVIGSKYIKSVDTLFFFLSHTTGDSVCQFKDGVVTVLLNYDFSLSGLRINQIDYANGDLYWVDGSNEPRFINIQMALNGDYISPVDEDFTVIRRPPIFPLGVSRNTDAGRAANNIADKSFQFAYRYVYEGNKYSVLSIYSKLVNYAITADEGKNYLEISISPSETLPFSLKKIQLLYRYGNAGAWYIWKDVTDSTRVHNFYNDTLGILEPNIDERQLFDDVPRSAKAQTFVHNRLFYGNYVKGFNLPDSIGLTVSATARSSTTEVTVQIAKYVKVVKITQVETIFGYWYLQDGLFYEVTYDSGSDTFTPVGDPGKTETEVQESYQPPAFDWDIYHYHFDVFEDGRFDTFDVTTDTNDPFVKKAGEYQGAVLWSGFAGRNVGVVTDDEAKVYLTDNYADTEKYVIGWDLSTTTVDQIPVWATHYYLLRTNNLNTSFYLQGHTSDIWLRKGDDTFIKSWYNSEELYLDVSCLSKNSTGYSFTEGDRIKVWSLQSADYDFNIIRQEGQFIVVENPGLSDIGTTHEFLFEIHRPGLVDQEQRYYEVGEAYKILNPGETNRALSVLSGTMNGDTFEATRDKWYANETSTSDPFANDLIKGSSVPYEAMNPKDEHYDEWLTDAGRVSLVIEVPEERISSAVPCYSGELLPDSNWNELNRFVPANRYDKISENVTPILAYTLLGEHLISHHEKNTISYLIGEGVTHNVGGQLVVKTSNVIGDHRVQNGGYGCIPETIVVNKDQDQAFWVDPNGDVVRYTQAGTKSISSDEFGIERKIRGYCEDYRNGLAGSPIAGYDPDTKEYYLQFTGNKTLIFSEKGSEWVTSDVELINTGSRVPECFGNNSKEMVSFIGGELWKHSGNPKYNNFYGGQFLRELTFVANIEASKNKTWENLWIEADYLMINTLLRVVEFSNIEGQTTYLMLDDFEYDEGDWKAAIPFAEPDMAGGDRMRSKTIEVTIRSDMTDINPLRLVTMIFGISPYTL